MDFLGCIALHRSLYMLLDFVSTYGFLKRFSLALFVARKPIKITYVPDDARSHM